MNKIKKNALAGVFLAPLSLALSVTNQATAATITSTVTGNPNPGFQQNVSTFTNGDFTINSPNGTGDAFNDTTTWKFDFSGNPNLGAFNNSGPLTSALFTLERSFTTSGVVSDNFGIVGLTTISFLSLNLPGGAASPTFTINLLDYYSSSDILAAFNGAGTVPSSSLSYGPNEIAFEYQDDALISSATLTLATEDASIPEPLTLIGSIFALGSGALLRKRSSSALNDGL